LNALHAAVVQECQDAYNIVKGVLSEKVAASRRRTNPEEKSSTSTGIHNSVPRERRQTEGLSRTTSQAPSVSVQPEVYRTLNATATRQISATLQALKKRLALLIEFTGINVLAFQKILKKRAKLVKAGGREASSPIDMAKIFIQPFFRSVEINKLLGRVHVLESKLFKDWEFRHTMKQVRNELDRSSKTEMALLGINFAVSVELFVTMMAVMAILGSTPSAQDDGTIEFLVATSLRIWVMMIEIIFFAALYAMMILTWSSANINYMFILELDPHDHYSYLRIFHDAALLMIIVAILFVLYLLEIEGVFSFRHVISIPWHHGMYHMIPFIIFCVVAIWPFDAFRYTTRCDLWKTLKEVFSAPFMVPHFRHTFVADILTSMPKVLQDFEYTICHYLSGDWDDQVGHPRTSCKDIDTKLGNVIHFVPYAIRLLQCLRMFYETRDTTHLWNAGKYTSCLVSTGVSCLYAAMHPNDPSKHFFFVLMVSTATFTALYAYYWDIVKDWGLGDWEHGGLRRELMFKKRKWVYYWAMISDLMMRYGWMVTTLLPMDSMIGIFNSEVTLLLTAIELLRRAQWGIFRLENEQLHKVDTATIEAVFGNLHLDSKVAGGTDENGHGEQHNRVAHSKSFSMADSLNNTGSGQSVKKQNIFAPRRVSSMTNIAAGESQSMWPSRGEDNMNVVEINPVMNDAEYDQLATPNTSTGYEALLGAPLLSDAALGLLSDDNGSDNGRSENPDREGPRKVRLMGSVASMNSEDNMFRGVGLPDCFQHGTSAFAMLRDDDDDTDDSL